MRRERWRITHQLGFKKKCVGMDESASSPLTGGGGGLGGGGLDM